MKAGQALCFVDDASTGMPAGQSDLTGVPGVSHAFFVAADTVEDSVSGGRHGTAVPTPAETVRSRGGSSHGTWPNRHHLVALPELQHGLQTGRVGQSHDPEQLGTATAFVEVDLDGLFFLFKHLKVKINSSKTIKL